MQKQHILTVLFQTNLVSNISTKALKKKNIQYPISLFLMHIRCRFNSHFNAHDSSIGSSGLNSINAPLNIFQVLEVGTLVIQNIIKSSEGVYLCTVRTQVRNLMFSFT